MHNDSPLSTLAPADEGDAGKTSLTQQTSSRTPPTEGTPTAPAVTCKNTRRGTLRWAAGTPCV